MCISMHMHVVGGSVCVCVRERDCVRKYTRDCTWMCVGGWRQWNPSPPTPWIGIIPSRGARGPPLDVESSYLTLFGRTALVRPSPGAPITWMQSPPQCTTCGTHEPLPCGTHEPLPCGTHKPLLWDTQAPPLHFPPALPPCPPPLLPSSHPAHAHAHSPAHLLDHLKPPHVLTKIVECSWFQQGTFPHTFPRHSPTFPRYSHCFNNMLLSANAYMLRHTALPQSLYALSPSLQAGCWGFRVRGPGAGVVGVPQRLTAGRVLGFRV